MRDSVAFPQPDGSRGYELLRLTTHFIMIFSFGDCKPRIQLSALVPPAPVLG